MLLPLAAGAQKNDSDTKFLEHISVGGSIGTTGIGVEAATAINKHFAVRAGLSFMSLGTFNIKLANSMGELYTNMDYADEDLEESAKAKKVKVGINVTMFTGHALVDYFPWKTSAFHITAGVYLGNKEVLHLFNTEKGSMKFLNKANENVHIYNELFGTHYHDVGLKFGDYIFTADENGNIDTRMKVNVVRPYIGIGWGHSVRAYNNRKVHANFDLGSQFWGAPKFHLNNGEKIIKSNDTTEGGIFSIFSGFTAWPVLKVTVSGDIF